jgi:Protein of unknown function (DUF3995)
MVLLASANALLLFALGLLHFYWAIGGKWAIDAVVPTKSSGEKLFNTSVLSCVVVAVGLWLMSFIHVVNAGLIFLNTTFPIIHYATLAMGVIFLVRFVGDFKWVGIFKTVRDTAFAKSDTLYYTPLCLFLSISSFVIFFGQ